MKGVFKHNFKVVLDIGANSGQFGLDARNAGFNGIIHSFEPLTDRHEILKKVSERYLPWKTHNIAIGAQNGRIEMGIASDRGLSSSILTQNEMFQSSFPDSRVSHYTEVSVMTLDSWIEMNEVNPGTCLLKIDVQGFEMQVLQGAERHLKLFPYLLIELSVQSLYEKSSEYYVILEFLKKFGFVVTDIRNGVYSGRALLQIDVFLSSVPTIRK